MTNIENSFSHKPDNIIIPKYKEPERSPFIVAAQTHKLLRLFLLGSLPDFSYGSDYIQEYTYPYLVQAETCCEELFNTCGKSGNADPESKEAAHHAWAVFSNLPNMTAVSGVKGLESGYSRGGILKAPTNKREFRTRVREMKIELAKIAVGLTKPADNPGSRIPTFRTFVYFWVAKSLTPEFHLEPGEKEEREKNREILNTLLRDIDTSSLD